MMLLNLLKTQSIFKRIEKLIKSDILDSPLYKWFYFIK
ncbi:hypothetical protein AM2_2250 [Lactococcus cremoris]|nr:hypothetical protein llh_5515 [Lactococcus cremoris subsp. cremoris A76]KZK44829.1 hypothetical protein SK110_2209 [Lactococcus cremoris]KZK51585.1 hypothetical protein AM2_2250 [Lactococcus cremoris]